MKNKFFIFLVLILGVVGLTIYLISSIMKTLEIDSFDIEEETEDEDF